MANPRSSSSRITRDGDALVLVPEYRPWPTWIGFTVAFVLWFMFGATDIHGIFALSAPLALLVGIGSLITHVSQPPATAGVKATPTGLVSDQGTIPWSSCEGLELILSGDGSGTLMLRKPYQQLVSWGRHEATVDTMRTVANAVAGISGLPFEERTTPSSDLEGTDGRFQPRREFDFDDVRFYVTGGRPKPLGTTTSYAEGDPIIANRRGIRVGGRFARWSDITSIDLQVREDTLVVGNSSRKVLAGFVTASTGLGTWVLLRRTVGATPSTPRSANRRTCDQRELETLVLELRQLRELGLSQQQGDHEDVPEELAEMISKKRSVDGRVPS